MTSTNASALQRDSIAHTLHTLERLEREGSTHVTQFTVYRVHVLCLSHSRHGFCLPKYIYIVPEAQSRSLQLGLPLSCSTPFFFDWERMNE